jgi:hypothetical protein
MTKVRVIVSRMKAIAMKVEVFNMVKMIYEMLKLTMRYEVIGSR